MTTTLRDVLQFISTAPKQDLSRIRESLRDISHREQMLARAEFRVGDRVQFKGRYGITERGKVIKKNPKMIVVLTDGGVRWRVSPTLLSKSDSPQPKPGTLTEAAPPPRTGLGSHGGFEPEDLDFDADPPSDF